MGVQQRPRLGSFGLQLPQQHLQGEIGAVGQPRTEQHQRQGQITHRLAEAVGGFRFTLRPRVGLVAIGMEAEQAQGIGPLQSLQIEAPGVAGRLLTAGDQPAEPWRQTLAEAFLAPRTLRITGEVIEEQQHRLRLGGGARPLAPAQGKQLHRWPLLRQQLRKGSPHKGDHLGGHAVKALARIDAHDPAPVVHQLAIGVLQRQFALAHASHAREQHPAAWGCEQLAELFQLGFSPHEVLAGGGAFRQVVGGVLRESGAGVGAGIGSTNGFFGPAFGLNLPSQQLRNREPIRVLINARVTFHAQPDGILDRAKLGRCLAGIGPGAIRCGRLDMGCLADAVETLRICVGPAGDDPAVGIRAAHGHALGQIVLDFLRKLLPCAASFRLWPPALGWSLGRCIGWPAGCSNSSASHQLPNPAQGLAASFAVAVIVGAPHDHLHPSRPGRSSLLAIELQHQPAAGLVRGLRRRDRVSAQGRLLPRRYGQHNHRRPRQAGRQRLGRWRALHQDFHRHAQAGTAQS